MTLLLFWYITYITLSIRCSFVLSLFWTTPPKSITSKLVTPKQPPQTHQLKAQTNLKTSGTFDEVSADRAVARIQDKSRMLESRPAPRLIRVVSRDAGVDAPAARRVCHARQTRTVLRTRDSHAVERLKELRRETLQSKVTNMYIVTWWTPCTVAVQLRLKDRCTLCVAATQLNLTLVITCPSILSL